MLAARLRALRRAGAPAEALSASLRLSIPRAAFSTTQVFRKPAVENPEDNTLPIGYGTRLPLAIQAIYAEPLRRQATHNLPVCDLQLRSYSVRNLEFMCDFAMRAAYYCNLPAFGPVPLPKKTERWTVPRSNFVHKKSQENFERITHKRLIQIKDGNPESVELWLAFLRKHQFHGVGFKANVFNWEPLGGSQIKLGSLRDPAEPRRQRVGPSMHPKTMEKVEEILGSKEYRELMEELSEEQPTEEPAAKAAQDEDIISGGRRRRQAKVREYRRRWLEKAKFWWDLERQTVDAAHDRYDSISSEIRNAQIELAESRVNIAGDDVKNAHTHVISARADHVAEQIEKVRGHVVSARAERLAEEIANAFEHVSAARGVLNTPAEETPLEDAQKQEQEEINQAQPEELVAIAREAVEAEKPTAAQSEVKAAKESPKAGNEKPVEKVSAKEKSVEKPAEKVTAKEKPIGEKPVEKVTSEKKPVEKVATEQKPAEKVVQEKAEEWKPGQAWPTVKKDS